jgi:hypothetical protein
LARRILGQCFSAAGTRPTVGSRYLASEDFKSHI